MSSLSFYCSSIAFFLGVGIGTVFPLVTSEILFLFLIAVVVGAVWRVRGEAAGAAHLLSFSFTIVFLAIGFLRTNVASDHFDSSPLEEQVGRTVELVGSVIREPDVRETSVHLYVSSGEDLILVTADPFTSVRYGDAVRVEGRLERPTSFTTDLGREFSYPNYLKARGVEYRISFALVEVQRRGGGNPVLATLYNSKRALMDSIESVIGEPQAGLGEGLLLGVKQALGEDLERAFRVTGIIHIVVLSGYNVMLVVAFVMFILSFFLHLRARVLFGIVAIVCFAFLVGLSATVVRASVMASLLLVAQAFGRTYNITRALLFAGAMMVLLNPYILLYDIGFQLSFMATLGLILIAPQFESLLAQGVSLSFREYVIATTATQIAVLPLLMYHIGEISLISVVVNSLILPAVPFAMLATFAAGVVAFLSPVIALPFAYIAHLILSYIILIATWFSQIPYAAVSIPQFPLPYVFMLYGALVIGLWWIAAYKRSQSTPNLHGWQIEEEIEKVDGLHSDPSTKDFFQQHPTSSVSQPRLPN